MCVLIPFGNFAIELPGLEIALERTKKVEVHPKAVAIVDLSRDITAFRSCDTSFDE